MDPLQFAYRAKRGVEDATLTLFNLIASHLDTSGTTVRVLFMDFSSAFNTIQPHVLIKKLLNLEVNPDLILWISYSKYRSSTGMRAFTNSVFHLYE